MVSFHRLRSWSLTDSAVAWYAASWVVSAIQPSKTHRVQVLRLPSERGGHMPDDGVGGALHIIFAKLESLECSLPGGLLAKRPLLVLSAGLSGKVGPYRSAIGPHDRGRTSQRALVGGSLLAGCDDRLADPCSVDTVRRAIGRGLISHADRHRGSTRQCRMMHRRGAGGGLGVCVVSSV